MLKIKLGCYKKISGAIKRMKRLGSSRSRGESSSCHSTEPTPTSTTMDYEQDEQEEHYKEVQAEPQAEVMEIDEDDAPYLDYLRVQTVQGHTHTVVGRIG